MIDFRKDPNQSTAAAFVFVLVTKTLAHMQLAARRSDGYEQRLSLYRSGTPMDSEQGFLQMRTLFFFTTTGFWRLTKAGECFGSLLPKHP